MVVEIRGQELFCHFLKIEIETSLLLISRDKDLEIPLWRSDYISEAIHMFLSY